MAIKGLVDVTLKNFGGGMNTYNNDNMIEDDECVEQKNILCSDGFFYSAKDNYLFDNSIPGAIFGKSNWLDDLFVYTQNKIYIYESNGLGGHTPIQFDTRTAGNYFFEATKGYVVYDDTLYICTESGIVRYVRDKSVEVVNIGAVQIKIYNINKFPTSGTIYRNGMTITWTGKSGDYLTGVSGVTSQILAGQNLITKGDLIADLVDPEFFTDGVSQPATKEINDGLTTTNWEVVVDRTNDSTKDHYSYNTPYILKGLKIGTFNTSDYYIRIPVTLKVNAVNTFKTTITSLNSGTVSGTHVKVWKIRFVDEDNSLSQSFDVYADETLPKDVTLTLTLPQNTTKKKITGYVEVSCSTVDDSVGEIYMILSSFSLTTNSGFFDSFIPTVLEEYANKMWATCFKQNFSWRDNEFKVFYSETATKAIPENFYNFFKAGAGQILFSDNSLMTGLYKFKDYLLISSLNEMRFVRGFDQSTIPNPIIERLFKEGGAVNSLAMTATEGDVYYVTREKRLKRLYEPESFKLLRTDYEFDNNIIKYLNNISNSELDRIRLTYNRYTNIFYFFNGSDKFLCYDEKRKYWFYLESTATSYPLLFCTIGEDTYFYGNGGIYKSMASTNSGDLVTKRHSKGYDMGSPNVMKDFLFLELGGTIDLGINDELKIDILIDNSAVRTCIITDADKDKVSGEFWVRFPIANTGMTSIGRKLNFIVYNSSSTKNIYYDVRIIKIQYKTLGGSHKEPTQI